MYKTYTKSREYPVELKFVDGTEKMIYGFEKVVFGCHDMDKIETLTTLMNEKQCEDFASKVVQDNKSPSVKISIRDVQNANYDEELSEKPGGICHTGDLIINNYIVEISYFKQEDSIVLYNDKPEGFVKAHENTLFDNYAQGNASWDLKAYSEGKAVDYVVDYYKIRGCNVSSVTVFNNTHKEKSE